MKDEHQEWIDNLKVGDMVCDCRYKHSKLIAFDGEDGDILVVEDGHSFSAKHCCGPVDHEPHWWVYLLRCKDGTYYIGITTDQERRLKEHNAGRGAKYTRGRGPCKMVKAFVVHSKGKALRLEALWKKVPKSRKTKFEKPEEME